MAASSRSRRLVLALTLGGAVLLVIWALVLAVTLPHSVDVGAWRVAWVGFDLALAAAFGTTGWLILRRRPSAVIGLAVTATMLATDAWFDVCLSFGTEGQRLSLLLAALVEVPVALLLVWTARRYLRAGEVTP